VLGEGLDERGLEDVRSGRRVPLDDEVDVDFEVACADRRLDAVIGVS